MKFTRYIGPAIGSLILLVVLAKCAHMKYEDIQLEKQQDAETKQEQQTLIDSLAQLASQHRANLYWPKQLARGEKFRRSPIMTAEVQDIWIQGTPILFVGILRDVIQNPDSTYRVTLEYEDGYQNYSFDSTQIRLDVTCSADLTAPLLKLGSDPKRRDYYPDTVVVATIKAANSERIKAADGLEESRLTAIGECIATKAFTGRLPRGWMNRLHPRQ